uniref:DUF7041 domain-containing protein n=1 Tax=Trichogramma kaykai TaxID=54128 RepID=A0ABD2VVR2_9HYME
MFRDENPAVLRERNEQLFQELEVLRQEAEDLRNNRAAIPNNAPDAAALAAAAVAAAAAPAAPAAVHRVAVKLPAFWPDRPSLWFAQADSQFILSDITVESTKFHYVVSQLDARVALEVEDIITNPPAVNPYTFLRLMLIERLSASEEQRVRQLISEEELGDRKPSQFLRHLRSLAGATIVQDNLMRQLWLHRLPSSVQAILATQTDAALDKLAELADKIIEISPCTPTLNVNAASTVPRTSTFEDTILKAITDLQRQVDFLSSSRSRPGSRDNSRDARNNSRDSRNNSRYSRDDSRDSRENSRSRQRNTFSSQSRNSNSSSRVCWYHTRYPNNPKRCISPCAMSENTKSGQ